jgi:hypothetical protein
MPKHIKERIYRQGLQMNNRRLSILLLLLITSFSTLPLMIEDAMAIERAKYTVVKKEGNFELRQYEPYIVAETVVEGEFDEVGNEGFRRLFDYISGKNRKQQSISMTAPVSQEAESEKISMTAPVNQVRVGEKYRITFLMPGKYSMETLPEPLDTRVKLKEVPGQLIAAFRYSGTWSRDRYEEKRIRLQALMRERGLEPAGEPIFARYNPPFMPWFLRRNEVLIPVGNGSQPTSQ